MTEDVRKSSCCLLQIPMLMKDIDKCLETLSKTRTSTYRYQYVCAVKQGRYQLIKVINSIKKKCCRVRPMSPKEDMQREIFEAEMESEIERIKIDHLRKEWTRQQETMARLQESLFRKCRLLSLHSNYCSSQGSALCSVLALVMENKALVESFLEDQDTYLISFVKIADGCLTSFIRTYCSDAPVEDSTDYKYILALYNCVAYISSLPNGQRFLLNRQECQLMLQEVIRILPRIIYSSTEKLKLTLLRILHDVSAETEGWNFLKKCSNLLLVFSKCLDEKYNAESYTYVLEILARLTKDIDNREYLEAVTKCVTSEKLKEMMTSAYHEVNYLSRRILQNISRAVAYILSIEASKAAQGDAADECPCACRRCCRIRHKRTSTKSLERNLSATKKAMTKQTIRVPSACSSARIRMVQRFRSPSPMSSYTPCSSGVSCTSCVCTSPSAASLTDYSHSDGCSLCSSLNREKSKRPEERCITTESTPVTRMRAQKSCKKRYSSPPRIYSPPTRIYSTAPAIESCGCTGKPQKMKKSSSKCKRRNSHPTRNGSKTKKRRPYSSEPSSKTQLTAKDKKSACCCGKNRSKSSWYSGGQQLQQQQQQQPQPKTSSCCCRNEARSSSSKRSKVLFEKSTASCCCAGAYTIDQPLASASKEIRSVLFNEDASGSVCKCGPDDSHNSRPTSFLSITESVSYCAFTDHIEPRPIQNSSSYSLDANRIEYSQMNLEILAQKNKKKKSKDQVPEEALEILDETVCTCACNSERSLVPYTPEKKMVALLNENDRRVHNYTRNVIRITSRLRGNSSPQRQQIVTRVRIPGLPFRRLTDNRNVQHRNGGCNKN